VSAHPPTPPVMRPAAHSRVGVDVPVPVWLAVLDGVLLAVPVDVPVCDGVGVPVPVLDAVLDGVLLGVWELVPV
jgi:hypothetical protein